MEIKINYNYTELLKMANEAYQNAYAPYSNFYVGACLLYEDGNIYKGCNVEISSYGLTLCAERNAISTAIANGQQGKPVAIAITAKKTKLCYPCGACRQWIAEFNYDCDVILEKEDGSPQVYKISELLPHTFELK